MSSSSTTNEKKPTVIICIGMAGSGKTSFIQRVNSYIHSNGKAGYLLNLDPAVSQVPFGANIDIRDTVNYKQVMKEYNLGPNGGILTSLNLFTTKFDQVLDFIEKRSKEVDYILLDTPGQIEIFTWSASGAIITDTLAASYPTVIAYIIDTPRSTSPATFMSNMLYACSIMYKTKLPFIIVFNKTDVVSHDFAVEWMTDYESFQNALQDNTTYMGSLINSMCLMLEEFYNSLKVAGVSAVTGEGMDEFFDIIKDSVTEYETEYKPELERMIKAKMNEEEKRKKENLTKLMKDMNISKEGNAIDSDDEDISDDDVNNYPDDKEKSQRIMEEISYRNFIHANKGKK
eukprot:jgi/Orpsp1_1/1174544/evm.model.c7180000050531.1